MAAAVVFDDTNWWKDVTVTIEADLNFVPDVSQQFVRNEPVRQHLTGEISGPLVIEGGIAEGKDRSLRPAVMLPTESTAPPKGVSVDTDETKQADRLHVFNDSSVADDIGVLSEVPDAAVTEMADIVILRDPMNLSGLGMRPGADGLSTSLTVDISEAQDGSNTVTFPGGITFDDIEITEILLGQGNDDFTVTATSRGTPVPENPGSRNDKVVTVIHGGGNAEVDGVMGGDHIVVSAGGGPASPLVVYGDTSQDGTRYDSRADLGIFTGNAFFFAGHGNDVIDARLSPNAITIYGGRGNDTIWGSQTGDQLAGGSGDDTIYGEGGHDHIYGDSGFNLDFEVTKDEITDAAIVTRLLTVPTVNASPVLTADAVTETEGLVERTTAVILAGRDTIFGGLGNDIVLADHGEIAQSHLFRLVDNGGIVAIRTVEPNNGADDAVQGNAGNDLLFGSGGRDYVQGNDGQDLIFGDFGLLRGTIDAVTGFGLPFASLLEPFTVVSIDTDDSFGGDDDFLEGNDGDDILVGGQGNDATFGGAGDDDIVGGHALTGFGIHANGTLLGVPSDDQAYLALVAQGDDGDDRVDAGTGNDFVAGDNARFERRPDSRSERIRVLENTVIYGETISSIENTDGLAQVTAAAQLNPTGAVARVVQLLAHSDADASSESHGDDYLAGGANDDLLFGQLGDDTIQGDSAIALGTVVMAVGHGLRTGDRETVGGQSFAVVVRGVDHYYRTSPVGADRDAAGYLVVTPSVELASDGDDYIEGNGGADTIFGNLGQDDIVGGSSALFGLGGAESLRPDGRDLIFGGAGTDLARNNDGDLTAQGHARDADVIVGDNANIYRLVGINGSATANFLRFNYDSPTAPASADGSGNGGGYSATLWIVPRAVEHVDYTEGGPDFAPSALNDNGAGDEIHGESGDDQVYGQTGDDVLFGEGQDDDLIGGWGSDSIFGGTGRDGAIGDDGRIYTSRNSATVAEPLYNIGTVVTNLYISTPGRMQEAIINVAGELKKSVNLTPFELDPNDDDPNPQFDPERADDVIFGGWDDDFLHGGAGDDAISGAEAMPEAAAVVYPDIATAPDAERTDGIVLRFGYDRPLVVSDAEAALGVDFRLVGFEALKAEEFAHYNEYFPRERIFVNATTNRYDVAGTDFFLNFSASDGRTVVGATDVNTGAQIRTDGRDRLFGDLGNDVVFGGTGNDNVYGGYGNDYLQADDELGTSGGTNQGTDGPQLTYEDRAHGGAGRDVLIANTGGDRLIDHVGEFNSYIAPFAPFGAATISRALQPGLMQFMYAQSASDGADPTRGIAGRVDPSTGLPVSDTGNDPLRNGEPDGELGLVLQKDPDWQDQTGAPDDPQAGNIPGGPRDTLRGANFNNGNVDNFAVDSGTFTAVGGRLQVAPSALGQDAAAVFYVDAYMPNYFEIVATINAGKPLAGWKSNAYVIFDYQSPTDFKFAGVNISTNKMEMGYRDATGWNVVKQTPAQVKPDQDYQLLLAINGNVATLVIDNKSVFQHVFAPRVDADGFMYGLNAGMVGLGSDNSVARIDNVRVQVLPPNWTLQETEDFTDGAADRFTGDQLGTWTVTGSGSTAAYGAAIDSGLGFATTATELRIDSAYLLRLEASVKTAGLAGIVFDRYDDTEFKFAGIDPTTGNAVIGHHTARNGWVVDAVRALGITAGTNYDLSVLIKGNTVSFNVNGMAAVSTFYNAVAVDGDFGLFARSAGSSFTRFAIATNDPAHLPVAGQNLLADEDGQRATMRLPLNMYQVNAVLETAIADWRSAGVLGDRDLSSINVVIRDLPGLVLGRFEDDTLYLDTDAAGYGWFVDATPGDGAEFALTPQGLVAQSGRAASSIDLLSVIRHELGHALGFDHDGDGVRAESLTQGRRMDVGVVEVGRHAALDVAVVSSAERDAAAESRGDGAVGVGPSSGHLELTSADAGQHRLAAGAVSHGFYAAAPAEAVRFAGATAVHVDLRAALARTLYFDDETGELATEIARQSFGALPPVAYELDDSDGEAIDADDWIVRDGDDSAAEALDGARRGATIDWARSQESNISAGILPGFLATLRSIARPLRGRGR
ncbi:MAG TPA: hypothetical protein VLI71_15540 [Gammaproteobacteria bacterium]|nr:hypothetical protein [Gammaproteobacteria bacterium]